MRILWLKTELLHPIDKGGKIRTYYTLKSLKHGNHVTYLTLSDDANEDSCLAKEYCDELITVPHRKNRNFSWQFFVGVLLNLFFSRIPYAIARYKSTAMQTKIRQLVATGSFDLVICDFLVAAVNLPTHIGVPSLLFQHNVEAQIWRRLFEEQRNWGKRFYLWTQWRRVRAFEKRASKTLDVVVAVSHADENIMRREYGLKKVVPVATGVDVDYFTAPESWRPGSKNLLFTGSMDWLANIDAIRHFASEVMPIIRQSVPDVSLTVVGREPPQNLLVGLDSTSVTITGYVDDVRPYFRNVGAYVVPLRIGGGTRLKIFEAMSMGVPVVSTAVGAEGLPLEKDRDVVIADDSATFAASVIRLLQDNRFAKDIASTGQKTVRTKFSWQAVNGGFLRACEDARQATGAA